VIAIERLLGSSFAENATLRHEVERLPAQATLSPCDPAGGSADGSLRPGTYELYVRVMLNHDDGSSLEAIGGPWPLEVR